MYGFDTPLNPAQGCGRIGSYTEMLPLKEVNAMPKKMPVAALKKQLKALSQQEMISLICSLYQSCPDAANILSAKFSGQDFVKGLLAESKEKIEKEFSGQGMKGPSLSKAKKVISDFKKVSPAPEDVLELKLHYAECVAEFGSSFGDIPDSFYDSLENVYSDVVSSLNKLGSEELFTAFYPRLKSIIREVDGLGYGISDGLSFVLEDELEWKPEDEESQ